MKHDLFDDLLLLYMTRSISDPDRVRLFAHLEDCPDCRAALVEWQGIAAAVKLNAQEKPMTAVPRFRPVPARSQRAHRRMVPLVVALTALLCIAYIGIAHRPYANAPLAVQIATPVPYVVIVLAARDIERGAVISEDDVTLYQMPVDYAPFNGMVLAEEAVGKIARTNIRCGLPVLANMLVENADEVPPQPGLSRYFACHLPPLTEPVATTDVVMAVQEMEAGATISAEAVALRPYPSQLLPDGVMTSLDAVIGRGIVKPLYREEVLTYDSLQLPANAPVEIDIPIDAIRNPESMLRVGAKIDIIATVLFVDADAVQAALQPTEEVASTSEPRLLTQRVVSEAEVVSLTTDEAGTLTTLTVKVTGDSAEVLRWVIEAKLPLILALSPG